MTAHTPGPWASDGSHIYASDGEIIAQVRNPGSKASDYPLEANRDLMTAAPDLLEELMETHAALCFTADYVGSLRYQRNAAAIAKATGESQP